MPTNVQENISLNDNSIVDFSKISLKDFKNITGQDNFSKHLDDISNSLNGVSSKFDCLNKDSININKSLNSINTNILSMGKDISSIRQAVDKPFKLDGNCVLNVDLSSVQEQNSQFISLVEKQNTEIQYLSNQIYFMTVISLLIFISFLIYRFIKIFI